MRTRQPILHQNELKVSQGKKIWEKDQSEMVWITSGLFEMGGHFDERGKDEVPVHRVELNSFYMDKHEVSNYRSVLSVC